MREHNRTTEPGTTWDNVVDLTLAAYRRERTPLRPGGARVDMRRARWDGT